MYIKSIDIKEILKSKVTKIIVGIVILFAIVLIIIYTFGKVSRVLNGVSIKNIIEYIGVKNNNIFNMTSYEAEYTMVVVSNKNVNSYNIKEIYDSGKTKYEYLDSSGSKVFLIINKDKIKIQNENQKNILIQDFKNTYLTNTISISTFLEIYNKKKASNVEENAIINMENIEIKEYLKNGYISLTIMFNSDENIFKDISRITLEIDDKTKLPVTYVIYNKNKKEIVSILYNKFNINPEINSKIFDIY